MTDMSSTVGESALAARRFYVFVGFASIVIALVGFAPSYFLPLAQGKFQAAPITHIHGFLFFSWTILFTVQAWLVAARRTPLHRSLGMLGVALATGMVFMTFAVVVEGLNRFEAAGYGAAKRAFSWLQVSGMIFFASMFALAIVNVRNTEAHKRFMVLATVSLLDAPIARWFALFLAPPAPPGGLAPPPPVFVALPPGIIADMLLVAGMVVDWRARGRVHPVYLWGFAALLLIQVTRVPISSTDAWQSIASWISHLAG